MENIDKIVESMKRHLACADEIELGEGEEKDTFWLSPLPTERLPQIYKTASILKNAQSGTDNVFDIFDKIDGNWVNAILELAVEALKPNYPEIDKTVLEGLVRGNLLLFADKIWAMNIGMGSRTVDRIKKIEEIRKRANAAAKPDTGGT